MKSINRVLAISVCFAALVAIVGCGSSSSSSSSRTTSSTGSGLTTSSASSQGSLKGQKLTMVSYGGLTEQSQKTAWLEPFEKMTGVQMSQDSPSDLAKVKAQVETNNINWDIVDIDGGSGGTGCGKYFKTRAEMGINVSQIDPKYLTDACGVPTMLQVQALMYNKAKYKNNPPTKVTDFLNLKQYPGKRALFNYPLGSLEALEQASGIPGSKVVPYNWTVIQNALKTIGSNLVLQNELAQQAEQLSSGNFDMCFCYNGRAAITPGVDSSKVGIVWNGPWIADDMIYATKGSKYPEAQKAFLNYLATPAPQDAFTAIQPYEPTTIGPLPKVKPAFKYWMLAFNKNKVSDASYAAWKYLSQPGVTAAAQEKWTALTSG